MAWDGHVGLGCGASAGNHSVSTRRLSGVNAGRAGSMMTGFLVQPRRVLFERASGKKHDARLGVEGTTCQACEVNSGRGPTRSRPLYFRRADRVRLTRETSVKNAPDRLTEPHRRGTLFDVLVLPVRASGNKCLCSFLLN